MPLGRLCGCAITLWNALGRLCGCTNTVGNAPGRICGCGNTVWNAVKKFAITLWDEIKTCFRRPRCKAVKREYFGCIGSSVVLQCKVNVSKANWEGPTSTANEKQNVVKGLGSLELKRMTNSHLGEYICTITTRCCSGRSDPIQLSILHPKKVEGIERKDVTFALTTKSHDKEYEWIFIRGEEEEKDITPEDDRYVNEYDPNGNSCNLTIRNCSREDNGIYICRDKKTKEQLTAYRLNTKKRVRVDLKFLYVPQDKSFSQNLIEDTERLLQKPPNYEVEIRTLGERPDYSYSYQMNAVAYLPKQRNATEFEEMEKRDRAEVCILFLDKNSLIPNLHFNKEHIAICFRKDFQHVHCTFDAGHEDAWNDTLEKYTKTTENGENI